MIKKHAPRKRFGQNFLHDQNYIQKIISAVNPQPGDKMIEIGPGQGAITEPLLNLNTQITAVEIDRDLAKLLTDKFNQQQNFSLFNQDALKFEFDQVYKNEQCTVLGNLPYNISTPLLFHLFSFKYFSNL